MKLRLVPVLVTFVLSAAVLFGGWFMYQTFAVEDPFIERTEHIEGVKTIHIDINREQAIVTAVLAPEADLRNVYQSILNAAKETLGNRSILVKAEGNSSEALEEWWSNALFDVAQAMETKEYSLIPKRLAELAQQEDGLSYKTAMDEHNVYISLYHGQNNKFVILPRMAMTLGVWPNE